MISFQGDRQFFSEKDLPRINQINMKYTAGHIKGNRQILRNNFYRTRVRSLGMLVSDSLTN